MKIFNKYVCSTTTLHERYTEYLSDNIYGYLSSLIATKVISQNSFPSLFQQSYDLAHDPQDQPVTYSVI